MKKKWSFRVWGFLAAVYIVSGIFWIPILLSGKGTSSPINMLFIALITFVPSTMGILFTYLVKDRQARRDFWKRAYRWPSSKWPFILAGLLILPALIFGAYALTFILSGKAITFEYAKDMFSSLPMLLQFIFVEITFGALSEELGWRGYLLDELQSKWSALTSALVLGVFWGLWHTPTFLVPGLVQYNMGGIGSPVYIAFTLTTVLSSVLQAWIYNNTNRSTLVAGILMHLLANVSIVFVAGIFDKFSLPGAYWTISLLLYGLATTVIVVIFGPKKLIRTGKLT